jgi:lysophospholipase
MLREFLRVAQHLVTLILIAFFLFPLAALVPKANALERMIRKAIHLHDEKYATARFGAGNTHKAPLALPSLGPDAKRILYTIYEYEPLLDSSNMTMDDWINIAKDLRVHFLPLSL